MIRALLIEDQAAVRADLRALLAAHPEIEVVGEADSLKAARLLLARPDYDLVFLDVQIIGGTGFEVVPHVRTGARVIFVTAHDHYALRAFEVNALDYLLKPVKAERLASALARVNGSESPASPAATPRLLAWGDVVHLNSGTAARFALVADLAAIEAEENYSRVHLADAERVLVRRSLKAWEEILPPTQFMRVHRTTIVNLTQIIRYRRAGPKTILLGVKGVDAEVPVGREIWPELKARLTGAGQSGVPGID